MTLLKSITHLILLSQFYVTANLIAADADQDKQLRTASRRGTGTVACEIGFQLQNDRYLAETDDGLNVILLKGDDKNSIYHFVPDYKYIQGCDQLGVIPFAGGATFVVWKWCEGHLCPVRNGAVMFNPLNRQVFRLEYEEGKGLTLSKNLANPENGHLRAWLLKWWEQWPGHPVPEADIIYKTLDK